MTAEDDAGEVLRYMLKYSRSLQDMIQNYDDEEIDEAMISATADAINKAEKPQTRREILSVAALIGQGIESERVVSFANQHLEEWMDKYGE